MPDTEIAIALQGYKVDSKMVSNTIARMREALDEIERSITQETPQAAWEPEQAVVRVVASANGVKAEALAQIAHDFYSGFAVAAGQAHAWPATITPKARRAITQLVKQVAQLESVTVDTTGEPSLVVRKAEMPGQLEAHAVERRYSEYTSLDGRLDLISVRGSPRFTIQDLATGRHVPCKFDDALIDRVKAALGKRVVIEGVVRYRASGTPSSITKVHNIWTRPEPLKDIDELIGVKPDFAGDEDADVLVRRRRRGGV